MLWKSRETAIPPYTQKNIVYEVNKFSNQSLFVSHSPYILEEFTLSQTIAVSKRMEGEMQQSTISLPDGIKPKMYRRQFRIRFCEGLLSRRVLVVEGTTEMIAIPVVARRLAELNPSQYTPLESLGIVLVDAIGDKSIPAVADLYTKLNKTVFALCDKQAVQEAEEIEKAVEQLFMHDEKGFEKLIVKGTTADAINKYIQQTFIDWPDKLKRKYPDPKIDPQAALIDYFIKTKADGTIADFLGQCNETEIPKWVKKCVCEPE